MNVVLWYADILLSSTQMIEFSTFYTCSRINSIPFFDAIHHGDKAKLEQLAELFFAKAVPPR
jgi:hypothetical protein